jgi:hypothetical protein
MADCQWRSEKVNFKSKRMNGLPGFRRAVLFWLKIIDLLVNQSEPNREIFRLLCHFFIQFIERKVMVTFHLIYIY